jgi:uncharacterized protein (TIGR02145 family)
MSVITNAQYYISFAGNKSNPVDSVRVINITTNTSLPLTTGQVLHLWDGTLGIQTPTTNSNMEIYPNPMTDKTTLNFVVPESGDVNINFIDMSGKILYQTSSTLSGGKYTYSITGVKTGMYFVKVNGKGFNYSTKIISQNDIQNRVNIEKVSFEPLSEKKNGFKSVQLQQDTVQMIYSTGDRLEYKGYSGLMSTVIMDVPVSSKTVTFNFVMCQDRDGHNYSTVSFIKTSKSKTMSNIDTIVWMQQNMNVGTMINGGSFQDTTGGIIKKWCYNNDTNNCNEYGGLYQWYNIMQFDTLSSDSISNHGICPIGWHISTDYDWYIMMHNIDTSSWTIDSTVGGKLKEIGTTHWLYPNPASDSLGFTALPGGVYEPGYGFSSMGAGADFWASKKGNLNNYAIIYELYYLNTTLLRGAVPMNTGNPVRCVKN